MNLHCNLNEVGIYSNCIHIQRSKLGNPYKLPSNTFKNHETTNSTQKSAHKERQRIRFDILHHRNEPVTHGLLGNDLSLSSRK